MLATRSVSRLLVRRPTARPTSALGRAFLSSPSSSVSPAQKSSLSPSTFAFDVQLPATYHEVADETLDLLSDLLAPLEEVDGLDLDVSIAQGVLNIVVDSKTWVINKQTPNRQLWWSSPLSGPRRYEFANGLEALPGAIAADDSVAAATDAAHRALWEQNVAHYRLVHHWRFTRDNSSMLLTLTRELKQVTGLDLLAVPHPNSH